MSLMISLALACSAVFTLLLAGCAGDEMSNRTKRIDGRIVAILIALLVVPYVTGHADGGDLVNAVLGNSSYEKLGQGPLSEASEQERIATHLAFVVDLLSSSDDSELSPDSKRARRINIARLQQYIEEGNFPQNPRGVVGRSPNFLDDHGAVCAVGYLVEQDLGREVVAAIADKFQFDYVPYIDSPTLAKWQRSSGLSVAELAMIQPSYGGDGDGGYRGYEYREGEVRVNGGVGPSSFDEIMTYTLIGVNAVTMLSNSWLIMGGEGNEAGGGFGVVLGAASLFFNATRDEPNFALEMAGIMGTAIGGLSWVIDRRHSGRVGKSFELSAFSGHGVRGGALLRMRF